MTWRRPRHTFLTLRGTLFVIAVVLVAAGLIYVTAVMFEGAPA